MLAGSRSVVIAGESGSGKTALRLDGSTLAEIFLGRVTRWSDRRVAALNPGVKLPEQDIIVVHRSDGSGTTFIFTDYLSKISPEWKGKVGADISAVSAWRESSRVCCTTIGTSDSNTEA